MTEEIRYPSAEQVSRLYDSVIAATGGEHGFLSRSNLDCILDTVKDIGERLPKKQAIVKKAAFLLYNVIIVHPFLNGNKRTSYELVGLFLGSNGYEISSEAEETYQLLLGAAKGTVPEADVENWIARHLTERRSVIR